MLVHMIKLMKEREESWASLAILFSPLMPLSQYFEKSPTIWRIFNFYSGTARALRYKCICTAAKDGSTAKLVCDGHSCCCRVV